MKFTLPASGIQALFELEISDNYLDSRLGNQWIDLAESNQFIPTIQDAVVATLQRMIDTDLMDSDVILRRNPQDPYIVDVFTAADNLWGQLETTRFGFVLRREPMLHLYVLDFDSWAIAC